MKPSVLFLCSGNSARSQIAEAVLRHQAGDRYEVHSAGTAPKLIDPRTLEALELYGISTEGLKSQSIEEFEGKTFDFVITLCDKARAECAQYPPAQSVIAWNFPDPAVQQGMAAFQKTVKELSERINVFLLANGHKIQQPVITSISLMKSLADETRIRLLNLIYHKGSLCVCDLIEATGESQPKVSRHLAVLKKAGILVDRREGQWVHYQVNAQLPDWARQVIDALALADADQIAADDQKIQQTSLSTSCGQA